MMRRTWAERFTSCKFSCTSNLNNSCCSIPFYRARLLPLSTSSHLVGSLSCAVFFLRAPRVRCPMRPSLPPHSQRRVGSVAACRRQRRRRRRQQHRRQPTNRQRRPPPPRPTRGTNDEKEKRQERGEQPDATRTHVHDHCTRESPTNREERGREKVVRHLSTGRARSPRSSEEAEVR